jgi:ubiquinone biosynthesis protein
VVEKIFEHFSRYQEIVSVLIRHGFGFILLENMGLPGQRMKDVGMAKLGKSIRGVLGDLGPSFIKIGQFASTRPDIIPQPIIRELELLQDRAPQVPFNFIRHSVEQELRAPIEELFQEFNPSPLAAASIGQVHYAQLKSGEPVAVKVQRPDMRVIQTDLEILKEIIPLIEYRFPEVKKYTLQGLLAEFSGWLVQEQDYVREGKNAEKMAKGFASDSRVIFPKIFWNYTTSRVLTMSYLEGIKLNDREKISALYDKKKIAQRISRALLQQILRNGFFHGDPHPGNIIVLSEERIGFIDFGLVGVLDPILKRDLLKLLIALNRRNTNAITKALQQLAATSSQAELENLSQDLAKMSQGHLDVPIGQLDFQKLVNDCMNLAFEHSIELPPGFILLGKSLLILEGIIHELDPGISLAELLKPFRCRLFLEQFALNYWLGRAMFSKKVLNHD